MASAAPVDTRRVLQTHLIQKAWKDPEFRKEVVRDPKGMLEKHVGRKLPGELKIFIHEEDSSTLHFSLPPTPANISELSDEELERVAGGTDLIASLIVSLGMTALSAASVSAKVTQNQGW